MLSFHSPLLHSSSLLQQPSLSSRCLTLGAHHTKSVSFFEVQLKGITFASESPPLRATRNGRQLIGPVCEKMDDGFYMRRCVELAKKAIGFTSPNPMVGCVIVKDGEIVGEGFHPKPGQPHAEVFALREAGNLAENATAYVSLEPCNHHGRTPPCSEALINAKVKQVVVGMVDPNPIVASKGLERLKESGIDVVVGVEELLCQKLNEAYIHRMITGNPFVALRYSLTLNGRMSNHLGKGARESGGYYSKLLQEHDAIVVSGDLLHATSDQPISAESGANHPLQIIIAKNTSSVHLPRTAIESASRVVVISEKKIEIEPRSEKVETVVLEPMNLKAILDHCGGRGLCSIVVDLREDHGGGMTEMLGGCLEEGLVQKAVVELCPVWDAGKGDCLPRFGVETRKVKDLRSYVTNECVVVEGYVS